MVDINLSRNCHLAGKVVVIDGIPGCGKTMLAPIISTLDRLELTTFSYELEHVLSLKFLNKISSDACRVMIRHITDLIIYNQMMSREVNVRPKDLSSIFRHPRWYQYIVRMFSQGDEFIPARIREEEPVLLLTTHQMTGISKPMFEALEDRLVFIEVVRHPLYMIIQNSLNMENMVSNVRDFDLQIYHKNKEIPYYAAGYEEKFLEANADEKSILFIYNMIKQSESLKKELKLHTQYYDQLITVPFEQFVLDPTVFMSQICSAIKTKENSDTKKELKKQRVPRKKTTEGKPEKIYKRCGWNPGTPGLSDKDELLIRRQQIVDRGISDNLLNILDNMSISYEGKYLQGIVF